MNWKVGPSHNIEDGLKQAVEAQLDHEAVEEEARDFAGAFSIYRMRPPEARVFTARPPEDSPDLLDRKIFDLRARMVEVGVLDEDLLRGSEHRRLLPFLDFHPETKALLVKAVPFSGTQSNDELRTDIILMREIDSFLHDSTVQSNDFPHIRELLKTFYAFIYERLHGGRKPGALPINFHAALALLDQLEFVPVESLRDLFYQNTYEQFKTLMERKGYSFNVSKNDFKKWVQTPTNDPVRKKICEKFESDLEAALLKKSQELKADIQIHFQQSA